MTDTKALESKEDRREPFRNSHDERLWNLGYQAGIEYAFEADALLRECKGAMEAFTDPEDDMPADTGEFRDLKRALVAVRAHLARKS